MDKENNNSSVETPFLKVKGKDMIGLSYRPLFPYFKGNKNAFTILHGDFVLTTEGTGIVHMAPGFGEDDFQLCKANNIKAVCPVDKKGCFTSEIYDIDYSLGEAQLTLRLENRQVFETEVDIIKYLKGQGSWLKTEQYKHNYPHCWRTDTPLIYKAVSSWYVKVTAIKSRMVELNQKINWIPGHVKDGMFGKWLENTIDWSITRNRFWGCPVPIWKSTDPRYPRMDVYGSIKEIEKDFSNYYKEMHGKELKIKDLHRPFIDELVRPNPDDPSGTSMMKRVEDVLDCWFESGSMPFATAHYPFAYKENGKVVRTAEQNQKWFREHFPADFTVEYTAQTRGWFYTLMVLSTALFDNVPFLNCICHGVILDNNGQKLSKRLRNYPDPLEMFNKYGSDSLRFLMASSPVVKGNEFRIDSKGAMIEQTFRSIILSIWNSFKFLQIYMQADNLYNLKEKRKIFTGFDSPVKMDIYLLGKTRIAVENIKKALDKYDTSVACAIIYDFIEILNNWYIRRNKDRFWNTLRLTGSNYSKFKEMLSRADKKEVDIKKQDAPLVDNFEEFSSYYAVKTQSEHWRIKNDTTNNVITIIEDDKLYAYRTLYSSLMLFITASSPLLPHLSEKIYQELA